MLWWLFLTGVRKAKPGRNQDIALVEDVIQILRFRKRLQERFNIKSDYVFHGKGQGYLVINGVKLALCSPTYAIITLYIRVNN